MKEWIAKQIIAFSEITGRPVPRWIQIIVSANTLDREKDKERQLTKSLRSGRIQDEQIPSSLVDRLDQKISRAGDVPAYAMKGSRQVFPVWAMACAAVLLVAMTLFLAYPRENAAHVSEVAESSFPVETTRLEVTEIPVSQASPKGPFQSMEQDLVLQPLVREQERLTSDVTNAIQYMADSFLPQEYAQRVNKNLIFLKLEISGSI